MGQACSGQQQEEDDNQIIQVPRNREKTMTECTTDMGDWRGTYQPEFVNGMLEAVWPSVERFSKDILRRIIEPAIKVSLGSLGEAFHIDFDDYSIGPHPVKFGKMLITQGEQHTVDKDPMKVMLVRTTVEWEGNISIYVIMKGLRCGVTKVVLKGDVLMELVGSSPKPPLFLGGRGCFINPPDLKIDYDVGAINHLLALAPIDRTIQKAILETVTNKLVIPNRFGVRFDRCCEMFRIIKPRPKGLLKVTFLRGNNLVGMDHSLLSKSSSDSFLKVRCGAMTFQSPVVSRNLNPVYDWSILMPIDLPHEQIMHIEVYDQDTFSSDDFMGRVPPKKVAEIMANPGKEETYQLADSSGRTGKHGSITLTTEWRPLLLPRDEPDAVGMLNSKVAVVFVGIYFARHVPTVEDNVRYWVEMQCTNRLGLGGQPIDKPRFTAKHAIFDQPPAADVDVAEEIRVFERRRKICEKYNMSHQDIVNVLGVDPKSVEKGTVVPTEVRWNFAVDFFISDLKTAEVEITLKCNRNIEEPESPGSRKQGVFKRLFQPVSSTLHFASESTLGSWKVPVRTLVDPSVDPKHTFTVDGSCLSLHTRLQVRCLGDPVESGEVSN